MKRNYKKLAVIVAVLILTLSLATTGFAANTVKNLAVTYRNIKVFNNGIQSYFANEPFIVNEQGRTYLALNDMALLFNKDIKWDNASSTITINDKPGQNVNELYNQVITQQQTISQLESKIKSLESQVKEKDEVVSIKDLRKQLLEDHDRIDKNKNLQIEDIKLSERKGDIEVEIYLDLKKEAAYNAWLDFEESSKFETNITKYLQGIVDDILDIKEYEDADITGFIEYKYDDIELVSFTIKKNGTVVLD